MSLRSLAFLLVVSLVLCSVHGKKTDEERAKEKEERAEAQAEREEKRKAMREEIRDLKEQLKLANKQIKEKDILLSKCGDGSEVVSGATDAELTKLKADLTACLSEKKGLIEEADAAKAEAAKAKAEAEKCKGELAASKTEIEDLKRQLAAVKAEAKAAADEAAQALAAANAEVVKAKAEAAEAKQALAAANLEASKAKAEAATAKQALATAKQDAATAKAEAAQAKQALAAANLEASKAKAEAAAAKAALATAKEDVARAKAELAVCQTVLELCNSGHANTNDELQQAIQAAQAAEQALAAAQAELEAARQQVITANQALGAAKAELAACKAALGACNDAGSGDVGGGSAPEPRDCGLNATLFSRGKPAFQSSTMNGRSIAGKAVDNNRHPDFFRGPGCAITNAGPITQWWRVDLGEMVVVTSVLITNRGDALTDQLSNFDIKVYETTNSPAQLCAHHTGRLAARATKRFECTKPVRGRFVKIFNAPFKRLTLCEVKVYGYSASQVDSCQNFMEPKNTAKGRPTRQSSTLKPAGLAVDNNLNPYDWLPGPSCASTTRQANAWWQVDLQASVRVHSVVIAARGHPTDTGTLDLKSFAINVYANDPFVSKGASNPPTLCSRVSGGLRRYGVGNYACQGGPVTGRFVRITGPAVASTLVMCEVEVFTTPL